MPAKNINIQPRQTPPKVKTAAEREALLAQKEFEANQKLAQSGQPAAAPEYFEGQFPDPAEALKDAAPAQAEAIMKAANPIAAEMMPAEQEAKPAKSDLPQEAQISNVDVAAGIESNTPKSTPVGAPPPAMPKPPSSRAEYEAQQRGRTTAFPDITDVFLGKVPGEKPINSIAALQPPPPPQVQVREITVVHEPPPKSLAYQLTRDFAGYVGIDGGWVELKRGVVLYETYVVEQLLKSGFDGLQELEVAANFLTCPACHHQFPPEAGH